MSKKIPKTGSPSSTSTEAKCGNGNCNGRGLDQGDGTCQACGGSGRGWTDEHPTWLCREAAYAERVLGDHYGRSEASRKYAERIKTMHDHLGPHEGCVRDRTQPDGSIAPCGS